MIVIQISDSDHQKLERMAKLLLEQNLAIDVDIHHQVQRCSIKDGELVSEYISILQAKTLAMQFSPINTTLREAFPDSSPDICSVPIVNMDWKHTKNLRRTVSPDTGSSEV